MGEGETIYEHVRKRTSKLNFLVKNGKERSRPRCGCGLFFLNLRAGPASHIEEFTENGSVTIRSPNRMKQRRGSATHKNLQRVISNIELIKRHTTEW